MNRCLGFLLFLLLLFSCVLAEGGSVSEAASPAGEGVGPFSPAEGVSDTASPAEDPVPAPTPVPARAYVLVTTATQMGLLPLPEADDYVFPLTQLRTDGTFTENVIHLTPEGVYMESSTCENHDCIDEGIVTLDNRKDRILGNMIICLPNQVTLQLLTPEEILSLRAE